MIKLASWNMLIVKRVPRNGVGYRHAPRWFVQIACTGEGRKARGYRVETGSGRRRSRVIDDLNRWLVS